MTESETITAEVVLKSKTGKSMFESGVIVTSKNISNFKPDKSSMSIVDGILSEMGFRTFLGEYSISIEGPKNLFERIFKTKIIIKKDKNQEGQVESDSPMLIPLPMKEYVEKIFFPEKQEYFE